MSRPSIFEHAGGEPAFLALATAHHHRCLADPLLNHPFSHAGNNPQHIERLAYYLAEVFGGPPRFSRECSDQSAMVALHAGNGMHPEFGEHFVNCFVAAADDAGLPADPELRAALKAYMVWAVSDMSVYFPYGATVPANLSIPSWSWDGLQP